LDAIFGNKRVSGRQFGVIAERDIKINMSDGIRQLLETLEKRFQSFRIDSEDKPMKQLPKLTANHKR
jgi:hypothetical protein